MAKLEHMKTQQVFANDTHFKASINLGWKKLDEYYTKLDESPIFCAAVVLHPRQKWRWFEKHWAGRQEWVVGNLEVEVACLCFHVSTIPKSIP